MDQKRRERRSNWWYYDIDLKRLVFTRKNAYYVLLLLTIFFSIYLPWTYVRESSKHVGKVTVTRSSPRYVFLWQTDRLKQDAYYDYHAEDDWNNWYYEIDTKRLVITFVLLAIAFKIYGYTKKTNPHSSPDNRPHVRNPIPQMSEKVVNCEDCGGIVSLRAESCPHCGAPVDIPES